MIKELLCEKDSQNLDFKKIQWIVVILAGASFVLSMIPIIWMIPFNYASAEDMNFGNEVHRTILQGGSFISVIKTAIKEMIRTYNTWQGNWACNFLHQFEPSVFNEKAYVLVPVLAILLVLLSCHALLRLVLIDYYKIETSSFYVIFFVFAFFLFQYIVSPKYGYFFYIGVIAYTLPVVLSILVTALLTDYYISGRVRLLICSIPLAVIVGGCGYPPAVLLLTVFILISLGILFSANKKRILFLFIPLGLFLTSLYFSIIAPGNQVRGGGELHMGVRELIVVLVKSLMAGIMGEFRESSFYFYIRPLFILVTSLLLISFFSFNPHCSKCSVNHPIIAVVVHTLIVSCVHAPEELVNLVAKESNEATGFSSGVYNTYYFVFMLSTTLLSLYIGAWIKTITIKYKPNSIWLDHKWFIKHIILTYVLCVILFCFVMGRHLIGNTVDYMCVNYIKSGALKDYDYQMRERIKILSNDSVNDAVVPQMNYSQGPFQHFSLSENDKNAWANVCTAKFYGKKSVLAIDRESFYEQYGYVLDGD